MEFNVKERTKEITLRMTRVKSVVGTSGEVDIAHETYNILSEMQYFKENPENLYLLDCKDDIIGRKVVVAELNGRKSKKNDTILLIGHIDTVGTSDYGELEEYATNPEELAKRFGSLKLSDEVRKDLESGDFIFGRGIFDMKAGCAGVMAMMEKISEDLDDFDGNLIFGAVCDEEGDSVGMLNLVPHLQTLKKEKGYNYLALLDPDYCAPIFPGDPQKYVYIGTVGKLMPTFLVVGKETHVGEAFDGLDSNLIASAIMTKIDMNIEFCDEAEGEVTLPPISLKQRDLKPEYSVQTSNKSIIFFNYATHQITPDKVMEQMISAGQECFEKVVDNLDINYQKYCERVNREYSKKPWVARTISYQELYNNVKKEKGDELDKLIEAYTLEISSDESLDVRDKVQKMTEYVHSLWSDKEPVVIVFFTPPYYPHVYVDENAREKDRALLNAMTEAVETVSKTCEHKIVQKKFFPFISDLSFARAPKEDSIIRSLKENIPGFGDLYDLPLGAMQDLDVPVADIGVAGRDAHRFTERLEAEYSFATTPELIYNTVLGLLK